MLTECSFNVGPQSQITGQHLTCTGSMYGYAWLGRSNITIIIIVVFIELFACRVH